MIFAYNKEQVGDVLMVIFQDTKDIKRQVEHRGKVARVFAEESGKTLAWNIFEASSLIAVEGNGQVFLTDEDVATLNTELAKEGFSEKLENTAPPVFVVGQISQEQYREIRFGDEGQEFKLMPIEDFIKAEGVIPQLQERVRDYVERY